MSAVQLMEYYKPREIRFLELWERDDWRVKVYGIAYQGREMPGHEMKQAARALTFNQLSALDPDQHYGAAFVIIHLARETDIVMIDWWTWENAMGQTVFSGPQDRPGELQDSTSRGLIACVWELEVQNFERLAWIEHVLKRPAGPDLKADTGEYFERRLNGRV